MAAGGAGYGLYLNSQQKPNKPVSQTAQKTGDTRDKALQDFASKSINSSLEADRKASAKKIADKINEPGEEKKRIHEEVLKKSTVSTQEAEKRVDKQLAEVKK